MREAKYALEELGAVGVGVLTNHEGLYPGEALFDPLWEFLQGRAGGEGRGVVFIHPTEPVIKLEDGRLVNSRPCKSLIVPKYANFADESTMISTATVWSRRVLLRDGKSDIKYHSWRNNH